MGVSIIRGVGDLPGLAGVQRVVFLGDSITYSGQYIELIDTYARIHDSGAAVEFLNLGLPSETVSGLSEDGHAGGRFPRPDLRERLDRVLARTKPDLVIAGYGMNCGIYLRFDQHRFQQFQEGIRHLRKQCEGAGARVLHVTPPNFDEKQGGHAGYAETLHRYSQWLLDQRAAGWDVVDLNSPMTRFLNQRRVADPDYFLARDGVHCNATGHWIIARQILTHLGAPDLDMDSGPEQLWEGHPQGPNILDLVRQRQRLLKDAWLTATGHERPGMKKGLPLEEARTKAAHLEQEIHRHARDPKVRVLMDGSSLEAFEFAEDAWSIDDTGSLTCHFAESTDRQGRTRQRGMGYIWTRRDYRDFDLRLSYNLSEGANSGVFYRTDKANPVQGGFEIQLMDDEAVIRARGGTLDGRKRNGSFYDAKAPSAYPARPAGEWNDFRLKCQGPRIQVWINNTRVIDVDVDQWDTPGKNPDGSSNKFRTALRDLPRAGRIGLQNHGQPVWFKNIRIQEL